MLTLGKSLNRNYNLRLSFLDGYYNIGLFFNNKSTFLLFSVDSDFSQSESTELKENIKINMFKNVESSRFCETFLNLHNYRSKSLDILNQFKEIKPEFTNDVNFILNETIVLGKIVVDENIFFDQLLIYVMTMPAYHNEFIYLIVERQNIVPKLKKKIVRTSSLQISTSRSLSLVEDFYRETKKSEKVYETLNIPITGEINIE